MYIYNKLGPFSDLDNLFQVTRFANICDFQLVSLSGCHGKCILFKEMFWNSRHGNMIKDNIEYLPMENFDRFEIACSDEDQRMSSLNFRMYWYIYMFTHI